MLLSPSAVTLKKYLEELLAQVPASISDKNKDLQILRTAIIAEHDAINLYEQMANEADNEDVKAVLLSVAQEEKVHIGEFEYLLELLDPEHEQSEEEGEEEVETELEDL